MINSYFQKYKFFRVPRKAKMLYLFWLWLQQKHLDPPPPLPCKFFQPRFWAAVNQISFQTQPHQLPGGLTVLLLQTLTGYIHSSYAYSKSKQPVYLMTSFSTTIRMLCKIKMSLNLLNDFACTKRVRLHNVRMNNEQDNLSWKRC